MPITAADLHALGDYQQARDLNEDTLTRCRHVLGENHPSTMLTTANLVSTLRAQGQHHQGPTPRKPNQTNIRCPAPSPWQR
ncbi:MAG: tetratricopeptide repeat protein [Pseudonocardiales bacterium]|nr:tetratricopeptide repeat protein [Pseudonocardiales bacterium]